MSPRGPRLAATAFALLAAAPHSYAQTSPPLQAVKPLVDSWRKCAMDKTSAFLRSGEGAEVIAKVALYECRDQKQPVLDALFRVDQSRALSAAAQLETDLRDYLVSLVVQVKSK